MSDYLGSVLEELVPRFEDDDGDWGRIVAETGAETPTMTAYVSPLDTASASKGRHERPDRWKERWFTRRRLTIIALTGLLAALLATPALGIGGRVLELVQGTPAPPAVQTFFATSDAYKDVARSPDEVAKALDGLVRVPVIASEARLTFAIDTPDGPIHIWTAPTKDGRQCALYQWGNPLPNGLLPLTNIVSGGPGEPPLKPVNGMAACEFDPAASSFMPVAVPLESVSLVRVWFHDPTITQIEVELQEAPSVSLPVVAVGKGFMAAGTVPRGKPFAIVGRSEDGTEVARHSYGSATQPTTSP